MLYRYRCTWFNLFLCVAFCLQTVACSESFYTNEKRIANSGFYYQDWGDYHQILVEKGGGIDQIQIPQSILGYFSTNDLTFFVRQVVEEKKCKNRSIAIEISPSFEYYMLSKEAELIGPLSKDEIVTLLKNSDFPNDVIATIEKKFLSIETNNVLEVRRATDCRLKEYGDAALLSHSLK